jgi:pyruvate dehydrogenase E1 component alpha subunit
MQMYDVMTTARRCDERLRALIMSGQVQAIYYSPCGQEAVPAALSPLLRPDDSLVATYRGLHDHIAKGAALDKLLAEMLGRSGGYCGGRGGPMHIAAPDVGVMCTTGIVGGGLPIANGLALASKLRGTDEVTVVSFGDGATNTGAFHEALNLASLWELPVVFLCQNNRYAEHTAFADGARIEAVAVRAAAYGMPGVTVDGNDPLQMYDVGREAVERARAGAGPTLLEALTYRFHGHVMGDAMEYMDRTERAAAMSRDPVAAFRSHVIDVGVATPEQLAQTDRAIESRVDAAFEFALSSPPPVSELIDEHVVGPRR